MIVKAGFWRRKALGLFDGILQIISSLIRSLPCLTGGVVALLHHTVEAGRQIAMTKALANSKQPYVFSGDRNQRIGYAVLPIIYCQTRSPFPFRFAQIRCDIDLYPILDAKQAVYIYASTPTILSFYAPITKRV